MPVRLATIVKHRPFPTAAMFVAFCLIAFLLAAGSLPQAVLRQGLLHLFHIFNLNIGTIGGYLCKFILVSDTSHVAIIIMFAMVSCLITDSPVPIGPDGCPRNSGRDRATTISPHAACSNLATLDCMVVLIWLDLPILLCLRLLQICARAA